LCGSKLFVWIVGISANDLISRSMPQRRAQRACLAAQAPLAWFDLARELSGVSAAVFAFPTKRSVVGQAPEKDLPNVPREAGLARFDQEEASQSPNRY
jgi:hypothetical protein